MRSETTKNYLSHLLSVALAELKAAPFVDKIEVSTPDSAFGDYATNIALVLAKKGKIDTKDVSGKLIAEVKKADTENIFEAVEEKNGFVNFKLSKSFLLKNLSAILEQRDLYGCSLNGQGKNIIVEYFQNNVAKPPHIGHLRSAVIGDCLLRIFKSQGYKTISDTHIGDWGVQFGILILAYKTLKPDGVALEKDPITELNRLYVEMSAKIEADPSLREAAKQEFKKLEDGDEQNRKLWKWFVDESLKDFENYRAELQVFPFDYNLGESFYEKHMPEVLAELEEKKLITKGEQGELYVDLEQYGLGRAILVKSDGATTYLLRDLPTYTYRKQQFNFQKNIYVVDNRQTHHFKQIFKVLELAGYPANSDSVHVDVGFMSLPEGAISTRKGTTVSLRSVLDEADKRALKIIEEKNAGLENKEEVAKKVALAAIKYFDLSHNRKTEVTFTWDKALSFEGNTGPYLQYTHARIHGILRKGSRLEVSGFSFEPSTLQLEPSELAVLRKLIKFPEIVEQVTQDYFPNNLCNFLFELSQSFNNFYQQVPVLAETNEQLKEFRFNLITATAQVIKNGLYLLGVEAPEEM